MTDNIKEPAIYRVLSLHGFFGPDDTLYELDTVVEYDGEPNSEMEPLNDLAVERYRSHMEYLEDLAKKAAEKMGRPFLGMPRDLDGQIAIARADEIARKGIMGVQKEDTQIKRVEKTEVPQTGQKRSVGRPKKVA